jgi:nucleoside 2-deoxyribosyltransferase
MKVYLAAQFSRRDELREYAEFLRFRGVDVTSRWLEEKGDLSGDINDPKFAEETAIIDLEDVRRADAILFFAENPLIGVKRGGRHVEFGYAVGLRKEVYTVGPRENIFNYLPEVVNFTAVNEALVFLVERNAN